MTKCHLVLFMMLLASVFSCKEAGTGKSLSEYAARSQQGRLDSFERYVQELLLMEPQRAMLAQDSLMKAAESDSTTWRYVCYMEEKFFLDPNSPLRDEELYIPVAENILRSPMSSDEQRTAAEWQLPLLRLNRPGEPAADFTFTTPRGRTASLYGTIDAVSPDFTLIFFSNPGCPNCKEIAETLSREPAASLTSEKRMLVVNIYPDEDVTAWLDCLPGYPESWVCGYDQDQAINSNRIYWLRAIPSLYLLDSRKCVILKDAPIEKVLEELCQ